MWCKVREQQKKKKKKGRRQEKGDLVIIAGSKSGQNISESFLLIACLPPQFFPHWCHNKKSTFDHIINPSLIELVQSRWLDIGTRGGAPNFKWRGWSNDFFGFEFSIPGFFWVRKFGKYFFRWLFLVCVFYQVIFSGNFLRLGNSTWDILGVNFWSRDFFWIVIFAPIWSSLLLEIQNTPLPHPQDIILVHGSATENLANV